MKRLSDEDIKELASRFSRQAEIPAGLADETLKHLGLPTGIPAHAKLPWKWALGGAALASVAVAWLFSGSSRLPVAEKTAPIETLAAHSAPAAKHEVPRQPVSPRQAALSQVVESPVPPATIVPASPADVVAAAPAPLPRPALVMSADPGGLSHASQPAPETHPVQAANLTGAGGQPPAYSFKLKGNEIAPGHSQNMEIDLVLDQAGPCEVVLYTADGGRFCELMQVDRPIGPWTIHWAGQGQDGSPAPSGIYTLIIQVPGHFEKSHVAVIR